MSDSTLATCPHCDSSFKVDAEQLASAGGRVRCGNCLQVFDGVHSEMEFIPPTLPDDTPTLLELNPQPMAAADMPALGPSRRRGGWLLLALLAILILQITLPLPVPPQEPVQLSTLVVRPHASVKDALRVDALLRNTSDREQALPGLLLGFNNRQGEPRAARLFAPAEYLHNAPQTLQLPAHSEVQISLSLRRPSPDAVNYVGLLVPQQQLNN